MLCQICGKNEASIHIQEILNGEKHTVHLCEKCAGKEQNMEEVFKDFNIPEMLLELAGKIPGIKPPENGADAGKSPLVKCPACSWDSERFASTGRLGCPKCYEVFSDGIAKDLSLIHRKTAYAGKRPKIVSDGKRLKTEGRVQKLVSAGDELLRLKKGLDESLRREEYELAAELRDRISAIEKTLSSRGEKKS